MPDDPPKPRTAAEQLPAITVPRGGGAIRGMGEKFAVNPVTGTGSREHEPGSGMLGGAHVGIRTRDLFLTRKGSS
jgi:hypothetical protein